MLLFAPTLFAQNRESLRGISAVPVSVQVSDGSGTTSSLLQSYVELQLRKAGIRVPSNNERTKKDGDALLYVKVWSWNHEIRSVEVELVQLVNLNRDPTIKATVATWEVRTWGGDRASTDADIKRAVSDILDDFINDYLAVNSK
jgi:hypothetical protein